MTGPSILDMVGGLLVLLSSIQVLTTMKAYGGLPWRAVREMTHVTLRGSKSLLLFGGALGLMNVLFQPLLSSWIPPLPIILLAGLSLVALNGACLPPTILYLAASRTRGFLFASDLQMAVAPLRLVHLLNSFEAGAILGDKINQDEYRVRGNWQRAVRTFSAITPLIIVDGRTPSDAVRYEILHIIESRLQDRTFFVADEHGAIPALSGISLPRAINLHIATSEQLSNALQGLGWRLLFSRTRDIVRFLENRIGSAIQAGKRNEKLCDWMIDRLRKGLNAEEIAAHVERCPRCGPTMERRQRRRTPALATKTDLEKFPTMLVIGIDNLFDLEKVLSMTRGENKEIVVMGNRSPAFKDHDLLLREAPRFRSDASLALIFEKFPSRNDPSCLDPLVIVRRSYLLEVAPKLQAATLGEFAILMTIEASARNLKVSYV